MSSLGCQINLIDVKFHLQKCLEYVFLSAGKFMPGMEKLAGELFFPTNQQLFLTTEGSKNSWF